MPPGVLVSDFCSVRVYAQAEAARIRRKNREVSMRVGLAVLALCGFALAGPRRVEVEINYDPGAGTFAATSLSATLSFGVLDPHAVAGVDPTPFLGEGAVSGIEPTPFLGAGETYSRIFFVTIPAQPGDGLYLTFDGVARTMDASPQDVGRVFALPFDPLTGGIPPDPIHARPALIDFYPPDPAVPPDPVMEATIPLFGYASPGVEVGSVTVSIFAVPEPSLLSLLFVFALFALGATRLR
jgi:hypothetical protein